MIDFRMPSLGADMEAGTLVEWLVQPGDKVKRGDVVAVVETQKGAIEIETFNAGVMSELVASVGDRVPVGTILARIEGTMPKAAPAPLASPAAPGAPPWPASASAAPVVAAPLPPRAVPPAAHSAMPATPPPRAIPPAPPSAVLPVPAASSVRTISPARPSATAPDRQRASPAARRIAGERGIDLRAVAGTGPGGAITVADLEAAKRPPRDEVPRRRAGFDPVAMRQAIAAAMSRSKREIPHYYLTQTIEVSAALAQLERLNSERPPPMRILPAALILRAIAQGMAKTPDLNGFWEDGRFRPGDGIHVGWAIALRGGGLVAPAIRDANSLSLDELMAAMRDVVQRARASGLRGSELTDPTVTVTSLGDRGAESVLPIIYPPQVAMIGVGRIVIRPWVVDGAIGPRPVVTVTLAGDHRASDGHRGGLLLAEIDRLLREAETS